MSVLAAVNFSTSFLRFSDSAWALAVAASDFCSFDFACETAFEASESLFLNASISTRSSARAAPCSFLRRETCAFTKTCEKERFSRSYSIMVK